LSNATGPSAQALLKGFSICGFRRFILSDGSSWFHGFVQAGFVKDLAREVCEHYSIGPGEKQLSLDAAVVKDQLGIILHYLEYWMDILPCLFHRIRHTLDPACGEQRSICAGYRLKGVGFPVLDFQDQQTAPGMDDEKVRMDIATTDRHVVPTEAILFKLAFQTLGENASRRLSLL
jgi:hypothetical protein